ncbi:30S ribosomal protein S8 [Candidatus Pacearchaeota archaeon CG06_land_8_20_14_3_00_35_12]|nr:MAG: 30S ribosomal protein S8 [Candidatus Pacearchaeota archaeon CG06_land_8_20_14_3_00_35_12]
MADIISSALNEIMNAKKFGKSTCIIKNFSKLLIDVLEIMKTHGYVEDYSIEKGKFEGLIIKLGKVNECKSIKPRFTVTKDEIDKYLRRFLPARDFGVMIISTSKGLMTHQQAIEKGVGGCLIAYCY